MSSKYALILGGAACLLDDLARFAPLRDPAREVVIAVNDAGYVYEGYIDHWVTLHPEKLEAWMLLRGRNLNQDYMTWSQIGGPRPANEEFLTDFTVQHWGAGSSGIFARTVSGDFLSLEKNVLCGVPMEQGPNLSGANSWWEYPDVLDVQRGGWIKNYHRIKDDTRSMSGWTKTLLGPPTAEWMEDGK